MAAASGDCAMGILTLYPVDHCLPAQANEILCGFELALGLVVLALLVRDLKKVSSALQAMLACYCAQVVCIVTICAISLANADPTIEAKYAVYSLGHVAFAFALACRTSVLARVVYMSSHTRLQANQYMVNILPVAVATVISVVMLLLWMFTSLYAPPGTPQNETIHRFGFLVYGLYLTCYAIGLLCMSRFVIKLYVGLRNEGDASDARKRKRGARILWQMTISTVTSMSLAGIMYLVLGVIFGALRNEVAHATFLLSEVSMLSLLRFVRQSAEVREQHQQHESHQRSERELTRQSQLKSASYGSPRTLERQLRTREQASQLEANSQMEAPSQFNGGNEGQGSDEPETPKQQQPSLMDRLRAISVQVSRSRQATQQLERSEQAQQVQQVQQVEQVQQEQVQQVQQGQQGQQGQQVQQERAQGQQVLQVQVQQVQQLQQEQVQTPWQEQQNEAVARVELNVIPEHSPSPEEV